MLDLALDLGGHAKIWRSSADKDPERIIRGLMLDHAPGQETMSLLISPEGWLIGLVEIEDAELGKLTEPPWVSIKTQFGPIEGHVALIELLTALKAEFIPDLEVMDEGEYWEKRDLGLLQKKFAFLKAAIDGMAKGLERYGLSAEAAEDPEILTQRIVRIAEKVKKSLGHPSEHAPPEFPDADQSFAGGADPDEQEAAWDELYKHSQRTSARFQRLLEERLAAGEDYDTAFEAAMQDAGLGNPREGFDADDELSDDFADEDFSDEEFSDDEEEDWSSEAEDAPESQPTQAEAAEAEGSADAVDGDDADGDEPFGRDRHPLQKRAGDLWMRLHELFKGKSDAPEAAMHSLMQGAGDLCGGLAQALSERIEGFDDRGLRIVQLKRALRGAAFARGALFNLSGAIPKTEFHALHDALDEISDEVYNELGRAREPRPE